MGILNIKIQKIFIALIFSLLASFTMSCQNTTFESVESLLNQTYYPPVCSLASPFPNTGRVIISEISSYGNWIEIYNGTSSQVDLSKYKLKYRHSYQVTTGTYSADRTFTLPAQIIPSKQFLIVRPNSTTTPAAKDLDYDIIWLQDSAEYYPYINTSGYVELLKNGITVDFVRTGTETTNPVTPGQWDATSAAIVTSNISQSLQRVVLNVDNNTAADWQFMTGISPFLPSTANCRVDLDFDGLPDCVETPKMTYRTLPYYDWGARFGQLDVFVEIDYMEKDSECGQCTALSPYVDKLTQMQDIYQKNGIYVHFDVGDYVFYDDNPDNNDEPVNLCGGEAVPFSEYVDFDGTGSVADVWDYKSNYTDRKRKTSWYYMLIGHAIPGAAGIAQVGGSTSIIGVSMYVDLYDMSRADQYQAHVIFHEYGHNLGLHHGGNESTNYKPNYLSAMNYLYNHKVVIGDTDSDAYYSTFCSAYDTTKYEAASYFLDYSHGTGAPIDESAVIESAGIGYGGVGVDFSCNGSISSSPISYDVNYDGSTTILTDHNDWAYLYSYAAANMQPLYKLSGTAPGPAPEQPISVDYVGARRNADGSIELILRGVGHFIHADEDLLDRSLPVVE
ncbi:MAG: lamin tail domain-containing protein [Leptospirales bacterium]